MRSQSATRRAERKQRDNVRKIAMWRAGGVCEARLRVPEVPCGGPLDADEIILRSGYPGGHLDPENVQILCRSHHDWKHDNPEAAHERGLRRWSWERNGGGDAA